MGLLLQRNSIVLKYSSSFLHRQNMYMFSVQVCSYFPLFAFFNTHKYTNLSQYLCGALTLDLH